jgi:AbrB family looped-hinge helix DNA binding protein
MVSATMTSKGQLTIPKEIRERLGLKPGDKVDFVPTGDAEVSVRKRQVVPLRELFGTFPTNGVTLTIEEMDEAIAQAVIERHERSKR